MYKVIIADDEYWAAYGLQHSIRWEDYGFDVAGIAQDGREALDMCRELRPSVLISDIRMPGMDGLELLSALRLSLSWVEVVFVSGYAEFSYAQQAVRLGAFDYMLKQVDETQLAELLGRLRLHLDKRACETGRYTDSIQLAENCGAADSIDAHCGGLCLSEGGGGRILR
ncbi:MAG: response regulator [Clostridiales bacterium]|jgi:two-component system response regulator YesN|nr:response regulator [Clostridiales bacterium]